MLANRINRVAIRNFRSLEDVTVDLQDLTVLVGPNGGGKSNFLDALRFVSLALRQGLRSAIYSSKQGSIVNLKRGLPPGEFPSAFPDIELSLQLRVGNQDGTYEFVLHPGDMVKSETCILGDHRVEISDGTLVTSTLTNLPRQALAIQRENLTLPLIGNLPEIQPIYEFLSQMRFYEIIPGNLFPFHHRSPTYPLDEAGENLASMYRMAYADTEWIPRVAKALAQIVPGISEQNSFGSIAGGNRLIVNIRHDDGNYYDLGTESDGTIRVLALLTALYQTPSLPLMGIEEPELMIHPGALAILSDIIFEASHRGQIILTTHSPDLISRFSADSLLIVERIAGITKIDPIREDQLSVINDKLFSGGDLLRIEGLRRREQ